MARPEVIKALHENLVFFSGMSTSAIFQIAEIANRDQYPEQCNEIFAICERVIPFCDKIAECIFESEYEKLTKE